MSDISCTHRANYVRATQFNWNRLLLYSSGNLVASYCPLLANWIREADAPRRRVKQITNEDRLRLHQTLVTCRRALVDSNQLKKPLDEGSSFFKNTLRRLSVKKMEKYRAEALANEQGEVYKGHSHVYWAFAKAALQQTLSAMCEQDETQALEVFHLILTYAGLIQHNKGNLSGRREYIRPVAIVYPIQAFEPPRIFQGKDKNVKTK